MSSFIDHIQHYKKDYLQELMMVKTPADLERFRIKHLSRQGLLSDIVNKLKQCDLEEKRTPTGLH